MTPKSKAIFIALVGYPAIIHTAVVMNQLVAGFGVLLAMVFFQVVANMHEQRHKKLKLLWVMLAGILVASSLAVVAYQWGPASALFIPPVVMNLVLMLVFGASLLPGKEPVITRFRSMVKKEGTTPEINIYTRQVTWVWTLFFAGLAVESTVLATYFSLATWSLFTNVINYILVIVLFFGEYLYRTRRIKEVGAGHMSPMKFIAKIVN